MMQLGYDEHAPQQRNCARQCAKTAHYLLDSQLNNLSITSEISSHDRSLEVSTTSSGAVRDASMGENSRDMQWSASLCGVSAEMKDTPLPAYLCLQLIKIPSYLQFSFCRLAHTISLLTLD
ncbi:hypothetical protein OIU77_010976 [Salix suchowensis]|uniref:Uncharacterized protein n=1 Tax=Salix suchowensis TaxID=1278906 RepID=A0ABQ9AB67_9ROSI|nr:hypothetical protein OIU77_010976 [Salix suchowensis]